METDIIWYCFFFGVGGGYIRTISILDRDTPSFNIYLKSPPWLWHSWWGGHTRTQRTAVKNGLQVSTSQQWSVIHLSTYFAIFNLLHRLRRVHSCLRNVKDCVRPLLLFCIGVKTQRAEPLFIGQELTRLCPRPQRRKFPFSTCACLRKLDLGTKIEPEVHSLWLEKDRCLHECTRVFFFVSKRGCAWCSLDKGLDLRHTGTLSALVQLFA